MSSPAWALGRRQLRAYLEAAARERRTVSYSEACRAVTAVRMLPRSGELCLMLDQLCDERDAEQCVSLAALVVHKGGDRMPGLGYFSEQERRDLDEEGRRRVWEADLEAVFSSYERR
jgi:hypothetical protein